MAWYQTLQEVRERSTKDVEARYARLYDEATKRALSKSEQDEFNRLAQQLGKESSVAVDLTAAAYSRSGGRE